MAKQLVLMNGNICLKNTKNIDLGNSLKMFFEWNDENKNVNTFLTINERD
nr:hypothetical protein [Mycoplasmopsis bovis]